jgi:hypothetical protein
LRSHAAFFAEAAVNCFGVAILVSLDDNVEHGRDHPFRRTWNSSSMAIGGPTYIAAGFEFCRVVLRPALEFLLYFGI